jgi:hypothetical protein
MDKNRLSDHFALIKHQFASQERLLEYHSRVETLIELILEQDLLVYPKSKLHNCLLTICDLVQKAKELNEDLMNSLMDITSVFTQSEKSTSDTIKNPD